MLRLNCFFQANEGRYDEALQAAMALTAKSQSHQGCKGKGTAPRRRTYDAEVPQSCRHTGGAKT